jgi:hypothetical protein
MLIAILLGACNLPGAPTPAPVTVTASPVVPTVTPTPALLPSLSITLGATNQSAGISLDSGGDVDTVATSSGRSSGNGRALSAGDGNTTPDSYIQFNVDDAQLFAGRPTRHVRVEVDYLDQGSDTFSIQYDGADGTFAGGGTLIKTDSGAVRTAGFNLCDASFSNRDNGADFRIADNGDGAETILAVRVIGLPTGASAVSADEFGANPWDDQPDSDAIQAVLDSACSGDTIVFTSGVGTPLYKGYLIDKTLFLTGNSAKHDLTFTSGDPENHAVLRATADLKGYVVRLYARSRFNDAGSIDNIDFGHIDVDGDRQQRVCLGADNVSNGAGDNWGSWLPECTDAGDPWCLPGNIGMDGGSDWNDTAQDYRGNPPAWTTGIVVHDLVDQQAECGSALAFFSAAGTIENVTIDTAGDHVHAAGCAYTDNDGDQGGWSDGITLFGPGQHVTGNTVINPSDIGIVFFGGRDTVISNNQVTVTAGNYGAFGGIALHPWILGDLSGVQVTGNQVSSAGDTRCGGIHAGINLGPHMWGGACVQASTGALYGNNTCTSEPADPAGRACIAGRCQLWISLPAGATLTLQDNTVTGAQINYLVEGFDILGRFIDQNNASVMPRVSDWFAAHAGCDGVTWGALDKVAHHPSLPGWTDVRVHCER